MMLKNRVSYINNAIEWYDFSLFAYAAPQIATLFFPAQSKLTTIYLTYMVVALGFIIRPVGGYLVGRLADTIGKARTLKITMVTMLMATLSIGLLPTYQRIGLLAPIGLIALRIMQGLAVAGQYTNTLIYACEHSSPSKRGYTAAKVWQAGNHGFVIGIIITTLSIQYAPSWLDGNLAWRMPFLLAFIPACILWKLRHQWQQDTPTASSPEPSYNFRKHFTTWSYVICLSGVGGACYMLFIVYQLQWLKHFPWMSQTTIYTANIIMQCILSLLVPIFGRLADTHGHAKLSQRALVVLSAAPLLLYFLMHTYQNITMIVLGMLGLMIIQAAFLGSYAIHVIDVFPHKVRARCSAFAFNIGYSFIGGTAPMVVSYLQAQYPWAIWPGIYIALLAGVATILSHKHHAIHRSPYMISSIQTEH